MAQGGDWLKNILDNAPARGRGPRGVPPGGGPTDNVFADGPSPRGILMALAAALAVWAAWSSFYTVQPEQRAVIKRLGKVIGISDPGLHFRLPFGIDTAQFVATERVLKEEFGFRTAGRTRDGKTEFSDADFTSESLMLTGDLNVIDVEWVVQYRIADPIKYLYAMREPGRTLRDLSESVMRRVIGNRIGSDALTVGRVDISTTARDEIQTAMDRYDNGIHIITVELQNVVPPPPVQPAYNEVNEARQERERMINEATTQANQAIPRAEGEANRVVSEAEGYATERVNLALGESARFESVLAEYRGAPEVTRSRLYLETLRQVLPKVGTVMVVQDGQVPPVPLLNLRDAQPRPREGAQ
jgi:membrane protease subunit HflK